MKIKNHIKNVVLVFASLSLSLTSTLSAQGPNAPEAASFEPVDATDMVNLLTGDFTYVLPLLNVPGPEGGYPIALSYHAGIAMDQEASWVGLGWNLNPGAINRSVNGYPDDYNETSIWENFYDDGGSNEESFLNLGYSNGGFSTGLNFSWGSNKAFGGSVNIGAGFNISKFANIGISASVGESSSIGIGISPLKGKSGLTLGASLSDKGVNGNVGYDSNGLGFSVSSNGSVTYSVGASLKNKNSLGLNFKVSRSGIGISGTVTNRDSERNTVGGLGAGANFSFMNVIERGDFVIEQSGWTFPIFIPTKAGVFSIAFGKHKYEWYLNNTEENIVYGPLSIAKNINSNTYCVTCRTVEEHFRKEDYNDDGYYGEGVFRIIGSNVISSSTNCYPYEEATSHIGNTLLDIDTFSTSEGVFKTETWERCSMEGGSNNYKIESVMDVYEFPLLDKNITKLDNNNLIFPNFDNYNVTAQGISGSITPKNYENGNLFGYSRNNSEFKMFYAIDGSGVTTDPQFRFDDPMIFYFENEFSTYLGTDPVAFDTNSSSYSEILDYHDYNDPNSLGRRKTSKYVEYFTNDEIHNSSNPEFNNKYNRGYIKPTGFLDILNPDRSGVGAFTVVGSNGKRYHYSIPVYNKMTITRNSGTSKESDGFTAKPESRSYFERIQKTPYATHWLLTAITGPDYIDVNNNGQVDEDDYGYWVEFDYGKWSEAYGWKAPYGEDYIDSKDDDDYKATIRGYKQMYYLDKIKTRTHTAIFAKSLRHDNKGPEWEYKSVKWFGVQQNASNYNNNDWFTLPEQKSLKLDKIYLFKNEDLVGFSKTDGNLTDSQLATVTTKFPYQPTTSVTQHFLNRENNIINSEDLSQSLIDKSLKSIELNYNNIYTGLARWTPNTFNNSSGRLTLNNIAFKGKSDQSVIPPYRFKYHNEDFFNIDKKSDWGYFENKPWMWSMNEIQTPLGTKIKMQYESDDFYKPAFQNNKLFTRFLNFQFYSLPTQTQSSPDVAPEEEITIRVTIDDQDPMYDNDITSFNEYFEIGKPVFMDLFYMGFINYRQGCKINNQRWSRTYIDIYEQWGTVTSIVDEGDWIEIAGNWVISTETYMFITVKAKSPFSKGNSIVGYSHPGQSIFSFDNAQGYTPDCNPSDLNTLGQPSLKSFEGHPNQKLNRYSGYWLDEEDISELRYSLQFKLLGNKDVINVRDGDLRVRKLIVTDGTHSNVSEYFYNAPAFSKDPSSSEYRSSGTVSYLPGMDNYQVPYGSELPAPKVMYEHVTLESKDNSGNLIGYETYKFNTFKEKDPNSIKFGDAFEVTVNTINPASTPANTDVDVCEVHVEDNLSSIGQLLEYSSYNSESQLMSRTTNTYYNKNEYPDNQGVDQLSYQTYKEITYNSSLGRNNKWLINSTTRRNYSNVLKSSTTLEGNYEQTTNYTVYDEVTGANLETETENSSGLKIKTQLIPAYTILEYGTATYSMGSKVDDITNKNMLTQGAISKTYIDETGNDDWALTSVGITTWNNKWNYIGIDGNIEEDTNIPLNQKIWRKHKTFIWNGNVDANGIYQGFVGEDDNFNWAVAPAGFETTQANANWRNLLTTTTYDHFSMPLEIRDINNNHAITKMADNDSKISLVCNSRYGEAYYSGAEYLPQELNYLDQGVKGSAYRSTDFAHTGEYSLKITASSQRGFETVLWQGQHDEDNYKISVWVYRNNETLTSLQNKLRVGVNGVLTPFEGEIVPAGDWVQMNHYLDLQDQDETIYITSVSGTVYMDDFRIHPTASSMTSYVYNEWDELSYTIGANNLAIRYKHDAAGRLEETFTEVVDDTENGIVGGFKRSSKNYYNYKNQ